MTVDILAAPDERLPDDTTVSPSVSHAAATSVIAAAASAMIASAAAAVIAGATAPAGSEEPAPGELAGSESGALAAGAGAPIGVSLLDGGIIQVTLPPNEEIAGAEARIAGATVRALADGRRVPVLLVITGVVGVSVEARHVYASSIAASAFALVGESPVDRVIAHYLLRSKTETIPAQFFTSEAEAAEWLGQYTSED